MLDFFLRIHDVQARGEMELTCVCNHVTRMVRRKADPRCEICVRSLADQAKLAQAELEAKADMICRGDACGHCRLELFDGDECFECTHVEPREHGIGRYEYFCDHVFHVQCVRDHYAVLYSPDVLQPKVPEAKWVAPNEWKCPSCVGCMWTKTHYTDAPVSYCKRCRSSFSTTSAANAHMFCFFCKLEM